MKNIPASLPSPRITNGVIHWYEGDQFKFTLVLDFKDADGVNITFDAGDTITINIKNLTGYCIKTFVFTQFQNNKIVLNFTDEVSSLFKTGYYTYDIIFENQNVGKAILAKDRRIVVD